MASRPRKDARVMQGIAPIGTMVSACFDNCLIFSAACPSGQITSRYIHSCQVLSEGWLMRKLRHECVDVVTPIMGNKFQ